MRAGNFWILDADGLLTEARGAGLEQATRRFARPAGDGMLEDGTDVEKVMLDPHLRYS